MTWQRKLAMYVALAMLVGVLSSARSDPPGCDGTETFTQYCPLEAKRCSDCDLPCTQDSCYEAIGNVQQGPFSCRRVDPAPAVLTTRCAVWTWTPPPVGPPAPIMFDCFDAQRCEVTADGGCRPNVNSTFTMEAITYQTLTSPDCAKTK